MPRERKGKEWFGDLPVLDQKDEYTPALWTRLFPQPGPPLEIDWGCGKGRFLMAHAASHPGRVFLGVDLQLRRLGKLNQRARDRGLSNIRLLCADIRQTAESVVPDNGVDTCYVFFPDPWPKRKHHTRRLVNAAFLNSLHRILKPGGLLHLATDHADYFAAMLKVTTPDLRFEPIPPFLPTLEERTDFEIIFADQSLSVNRLSLRKK
jgi:tRNA (guanine-N7-)-methyltransferase